MKKMFTIFISLLCIVSATQVFSQDIFEASKNGDVDKVKEILAAKPDLINAKNERGATPLCHATEGGHQKLVEFLIANGANINDKDYAGRPALFGAAYRGHADIVKLLLDNDAEYNVKDNRGYTPMDWAAMRGNKDIIDVFTKKGVKANLFQAAGCGHISLLEKLAKEGADINQIDDKGNTPLHMATLSNQKEFALAIIAKGAKLNVENKDGETPLDIAIEREKDEMAVMLREKGAKESKIPDATISRPVPGIYRLYFPITLMANICIQAGPDGILLIDTGSSKRAVKKLKEEIGKIAKGEIEFIINSHTHWDHVAGNKIAGEKTKLIEFKTLAELTTRGILSDSTGDCSKRYGGYFSKFYTLNYNQDKILLIPCPGIHSETDLLTYFTKAGVVHMGDLLLSQNFPSIGKNVDGYLEFIGKILEIFPAETVFIGGHGKELDHHGLEEYFNMLTTTSLIVRAAIKNGKSLDEAKKGRLLKDFESYDHFLSFLKTDSWIDGNYRCYAKQEK